MLTRERPAPANLVESGPQRMAANYSSTASPVASPLPFRGKHVSGDALFSAALGAPRTPPPRDTAPTPGLTQAAEAPAIAPAVPQPPAASEDLNAQVATALSQVSAALSAQSMAAIASGDRLCYRHTLSHPYPLSHTQSVAFVRFPSLVALRGPLSCEIGGSGALPGEHRLTVGI